MHYLFGYTSLLSNMVQKNPNIIVDVIAKFLGWIIDVIYNVTDAITTDGVNALGVSIILLTIVTRFLMLPLAFKQQKSMLASQKLQPEVDKIRKKYGNTKDPEVQQKMNADIQALYAKHKVNPLSGCLPLLIQMPIFFALSYLMQNSYLFIKKIGAVYEQLAQTIFSVPDFANFANDVLKPIALPKLPKNFSIDLAVSGDLQKVLNKLTSLEWTTIVNSMPDDLKPVLQGLLEQKVNIDHFLGINLVDNAGYAFPGILIPILAAATTFLSSYLMSKTSQQSTEPNAMAMQKVMLYAMPLLIGFTTVGFPTGVGLYWITSTAFQIVQQFFMNKRYSIDKKAKV